VFDLSLQQKNGRGKRPQDDLMAGFGLAAEKKFW
jgi:hypothetical protein